MNSAIKIPVITHSIAKIALSVVDPAQSQHEGESDKHHCKRGEDELPGRTLMAVDEVPVTNPHGVEQRIHVRPPSRRARTDGWA